jgi:predicted ATP-grasp superfamily ATP-dependent carboligase
MGLSVVEAHVLACTERSLPKPSGDVRKFATRLILYAPNRCIVPDLSTFEETRDIPLPGVIVEKGEPVCSIITEAPTRDASLRKARDIIGSMLSMLITT